MRLRHRFATARLEAPPSVLVRVEPNHIVLAVLGTLDVATGTILHQIADDLCRAGNPHPVVLDARSARGCDGAALELVARLLERGVAVVGGPPDGGGASVRTCA
jgi:hypothetical protein